MAVSKTLLEICSADPLNRSENGALGSGAPRLVKELVFETAPTGVDGQGAVFKIVETR